MKWIKLSYITL